MIEKGLAYLAGHRADEVALGARLVLEASPPHLPAATRLELQELQASHSGSGAWLMMEDRLPDGTLDAKPESPILPSRAACSAEDHR